MKKIFLFLIILFVAAACNANKEDTTAKNKTLVTATDETPGALLYKKHCKLCHGASGKLGIGGAANLQTSMLTKEEAIQIIINGKNSMASYKEILSPEETNLVADYIQTLKQ